MADMLTDWKKLDWEPTSFSEIHKQVDEARQVLLSGNYLLGQIGEEIGGNRGSLTLLIAQHWHLWTEEDRAGGIRQIDVRDLAGTIGNARNATEALALARRIVRPLVRAAELQMEAAQTLTRFPRLFNKHMAPYLSPARQRPARSASPLTDQPGGRR